MTLDKLNKKKSQEPNIGLKIAGFETNCQEWVTFLTKSAPFQIDFKEINYTIKIESIKTKNDITKNENEEKISTILIEFIESPDSAQMTTDQKANLMKKMTSFKQNEIDFALIKHLDLDEKTMNLIKQKKKTLDPGANFEMSGQFSTKEWDFTKTQKLTTKGHISPNLPVEELKQLNLEEKSLILIIEITSSQVLLQTFDPKTNIDSFMKTDGLKQKHQIKDVLIELVRCIKFLVPEIMKDYTSTFDRTLTTNDDFKKLSVFTEQQKLNFITQRKVNYLTSFFSSKKCTILQKHLQSVCQRLVFDKLIKSNCFKYEKSEIEKCLNSLYIETQAIVSQILQIYFEKFEEEIPFELKYYNNFKTKENNVFNNFFVDENDDFYKKVKDYEKIGRWKMCEKLLKQATIKHPKDNLAWQNLMIFYLRRQKFVQAESCFDNCEELDFQESSPNFIRICFLLNRKRINQAEAEITLNLKADRFSLIDNLLMSLIQQHFYGKQKVAMKYFNVAIKKYQKGQLSAKSNTLLSDKAIFEKSIQSVDKEIEAEVWKELIVHFLKNNFIELAKIILPKIDSKPILKNIITANIFIIENKFSESNKLFDLAIQELEKFGDNSQQINDLILTKAGNCFFLKEFYEAELLFLRYFKSGSQKKNILDVLLMLGQCYLNRNSFIEAELVFMKLSCLKPKSTVVWTGLGISAMYLKNLERAGEALFFASKLESLDVEVTLYLMLYFLKKNSFESKEENGFSLLLNILKTSESESSKVLDNILNGFENKLGVDASKELRRIKNLIEKQSEEKKMIG